MIQNKLEQLERLRSEDTPRRPMITHTIDQSKQDKFKVTNLNNLPKLTRDTPSEVAW